MKARRLSLVMLACVAGLVLSACNKTQSTTKATVSARPPTPASQAALCSPPQAWLPNTPAPNEAFAPLPHPASDCGFYAPAWQRFLVATQASAQGPAFLGYPAFDAIFSQAAPSPSPGPIKLIGIEQAAQTGDGGVLVDQTGKPVYYAIHVNDRMLAFLKQNGLTDLTGIGKLNPNLQFPTDPKIVPGGLMELKSAWRVVSGPSAAPTYVVVKAQLPHFVVQNGGLVQKTDPTTHQLVYDQGWVALLALHVVFTLPNHPELVWSTFEHVGPDSAGAIVRDNAPAPLNNPSSTPTSTVISQGSFPLYKAGTPVAQANQLVTAKDLAPQFDEASQSFTKGGLFQSSVFRPYPGSKTDPDPKEDDDVAAINVNVGKLFADPSLPKGDLRGNYRLVGAIWIDNPTNFKIGKAFKNPINETTDAPSAILAGEGRLGSTAIESFTEFEDDTGGSPNCFSCHDTQKIKTGNGKPLIPPAMLNVSHLLSRFKQYAPVTPP